MKKYLSVFAALSIVGAAIGAASITFPATMPRFQMQDYQSGPSKIEGNNTLNNDYVTSINVGDSSSYSVYNTGFEGLYSPYFNGDLDNVLKTRDDNFVLHSWKDDTVSLQNILYFKKDPSKYKNIKVSIKGDKDITGKAYFEKYLLSKPFTNSVYGHTIPQARQYVPDAIWKDEIAGLTEHVDDNYYSKTEGDVTFPLWNLWENIKTSKSASEGEHKIDLLISFEYDGEDINVDKSINLQISKHTFDKENKDENSDDVGANKRFGFSAESFPSRSDKYYKDIKYDSKEIKNNPIPDQEFDETAKEGPQEWPGGKLSKVIPGLDNKGIQLKLGFIDTYEAGFSVSLSNGGLISYKVMDPKVPFSAIVEVHKGGKIIGKFNVYNSKSGSKPSDDDSEYNSNSVDASLATADALQKTEGLLEPLSESNSQFVFGTGTSEGLIKYSGYLNDSSLKNDNDYMNALKNADKTVKGMGKFLDNSTKRWTWNFKFDGLDELMRIAANENIPEVLINPVDQNGFGFWYKGANSSKARYVNVMGSEMKGSDDKGALNADEGTLNAAGKSYVDYVMSEFATKLSNHLKNDIYGKNGYLLNDKKTSVKVYIDFDEFNESAVNEVMKAMRNENVIANGEAGRIYGSSYLGWRSSINSIGDKDMVEEMTGDNAVDQYIINSDTFPKRKGASDALKTFKALVERRNNDHTRPYLKTLFYSTGSDFPGTYAQSDLSDPWWQIILAYKEGTQGWARWAYDFLKDNYLDKSVASEGGGTAPSGEATFAYGGDNINGVYLSKRMQAMISATNYVYKMKQLTNDGDSIGDALNSIGQSAINTNENNDYKWNVTNAAPSKFEEIKDENKGTTSLQVQRMIAFINSL